MRGLPRPASVTTGVGGDPETRPDAGFTLLEIVVAMTILAIGGVSIVALFAAAVQLQYKASIEDNVSLLLEPMHQIAQDRVDEYNYDPENPAPEPIELTDVPSQPGYRYEMTFQPADPRLALPGEGYWVKLLIHPPGGGRPVGPPRLWFIKRQIYTREELMRSVTYEEEREQEGDTRDEED